MGRQLAAEAHDTNATPTAPVRELPLTLFVSVDDVRRALDCSRSLAYEHLRRAAGRAPGERGLLRVSVARWECYIREVYPCDSSDDETNKAAPPAPGSRNGTTPTA